MTQDQIEQLPSPDPDPLTLLEQLETLLDQGDREAAEQLLQDSCTCGRNKPCCSTTTITTK
jgi:hypothetical protein